MPKNKAVSGIIFFEADKAECYNVFYFCALAYSSITHVLFPFFFVTIVTSGQREFRLRKKPEFKGRRWPQEQQQSGSTEDVP